MSELRNIFSWSFSASEDFAECRRRRFWAKYEMWDGWTKSASARQQDAWRLSKMQNRHSLAGIAVEQAVRWAMQQKRKGLAVSPEEAYETAARPILLRRWKESQTEAWRTNPKRHCCLHEHYYKSFPKNGERETVIHLREHIKSCIANFIKSTLPRLESIRAEQEITIADADSKTIESFDFEGIKIYAIPDYAYRTGDEVCIHDWKTGRESEHHFEQMRIYGLWANRKHGVLPEKCRVFIEYLATGKTKSALLSESDLAAATDNIMFSIAEMSEYLVNGDRERNQPLPMEDWELTASQHHCAVCNFYELCKPELANL